MKMIRHIITMLFILMVPKLSLMAQEETYRLGFVYGVQWGGSIGIWSHVYSLFENEDGFLVDNQMRSFSHHINGNLLVNAGLSLGRAEARLSTGYQGFGRDLRMIPLGFTGTLFLNHYRDRGFFGFVDARIGIPVRKQDKVASISGGGLGWRLRLTDRLGLDYKIGTSYMMTYPTRIRIPHSEDYVDPSLIRDSGAESIGIDFSVALSF